MKRPSFLEGVGVALVVALVASVAHAALTPLFGSDWVFRLIVAGLGLGYVLYLLYRSQERVGRVTTVMTWLVVSGLSWLFVSSLLLYLVAHLGMIWLVRSLYHQSGALTAIVDLTLNALALMGGVWALLHSGSLFLGVWTFFLVQALFVVMPLRIGVAKSNDPPAQQRPDHFQQAYQNAETALRKLSSAH